MNSTQTSFIQVNLHGEGVVATLKALGSTVFVIVPHSIDGQFQTPVNRQASVWVGDYKNARCMFDGEIVGTEGRANILLSGLKMADLINTNISTEFIEAFKSIDHSHMTLWIKK